MTRDKWYGWQVQTFVAFIKAMLIKPCSVNCNFKTIEKYLLCKTDKSQKECDRDSNLGTYHVRKVPLLTPPIFDYLCNSAPCHSLLGEVVWICQIFLQLNIWLHAYKYEERCHINIYVIALHKHSFFKFLNSMCLEYFSKLWVKYFVGCI